MTPHVVEFSLLLSSLAAVAAMLAAHVALGWIRLARRSPRPLLQWRPLAASATALGTGVTCAVLLVILAEPLRFRAGFHVFGASALWLLAIVGSAPVVLLRACGATPVSSIGSALALALLTAAMAFGWCRAAGFTPGVDWQSDLVATALVVLTSGFGAGWWIAEAALRQTRGRRAAMRLGASAVVGVAMVAGLEVLMTAGGIGAQTGSAHAYEVDGAPLGLLCGVLVPLALALAAVDVALRAQRPAQRGQDVPFTPQIRRRRRRSVRSA